MPLYEYQCETCGDVFELMQKFSDEPLATHAKCGGPVHRLISAPALQFKGSGWYITDYAKSGSTVPPANGGKKEGEGSSKDGSAKEGSSKESAPAASSSDSSKSTPAPAASASPSTSDKK